MMLTPFAAHNCLKIEYADPNSFTGLPRSLNDLLESELVSGYGIAYLPEAVNLQNAVCGEQQTPRVASVVNALGEWFGVFQSRASEGTREYIVLADNYGYCPVFYSVTHEHGVFISDSFNAVSSALDSIGVSKTLNVGNYLSLLACRGPQFQNLISDATMAEEISILPNDKFMKVTAKGVTIHPRSDLNSALQLDSIDALIEKGINLATGALAEIHASGIDHRRITLSGGVDSRLVLALLEASGHHDDFQVDSVDPRKWGNKETTHVIERDISIAETLRQTYGLDWWVGPQKKGMSCGFEESLHYFQGHRSNYSFLFRPSSVIPYFEDTSVTLRGGGGELLRATEGGAIMDRRLNNDHKDGLSQEESANWFANFYLNGSPVIQELIEPTRRHLSSAFYKRSTPDFMESMNEYYFAHRNRAHFGTSRKEFHANDINLHPLSNTYFKSAAKAMKLEERSNGDLVRKLFKKLNSQLLEIPFESQRWSKLLNGTMEEDTNSDLWKQSYDQVDRSTDSLVFASNFVRGSRSEKYLFDGMQKAINFLKYSFQVIEDMSSRDLAVILRKQHVKFISLAEKGLIDPYQAVSKVASATDIYYPQSLSSSIRVFRTLSGKNIGPLSISIGGSAPNVTLNGYSELAAHEQTINFKMENGRFIINLIIGSSRTPELEYAFYLMRDGQKVSQEWYQANKEMVFEGPFEPGKYTSIGFARSNADPRTVYKTTSKNITIA